MITVKVYWKIKKKTSIKKNCMKKKYGAKKLYILCLLSVIGHHGVRKPSVWFSFSQFLLAFTESFACARPPDITLTAVVPWLHIHALTQITTWTDTPNHTRSHTLTNREMEHFLKKILVGSQNQLFGRLIMF